jgi:glycosyltransferase involved in cell wall biosynthesis
MNASRPKVSVLMITYNHERFIAQAIESVLMQKVDFEYEIVIGEDFSVDSTRAILLDYKRKHADKIRLLLPEKNVGMINNFVATLHACTGEYIALLEGDDYWIDPIKLQRQVDFLEGNVQYNVCYHYCLHQINSVLHHADQKRRYAQYSFRFVDSLYSKNGYTASMMFRRQSLVVSEFETVARDSLVGDWPLELLLLSKGGLGFFLPYEMAVYREHEGGITKYRKVTRKQFLQDRIKVCERLLPFTLYRRNTESFVGLLYMNIALTEGPKCRLYYLWMGITILMKNFPINCPRSRGSILGAHQVLYRFLRNGVSAIYVAIVEPILLFRR